MGCGSCGTGCGTTPAGCKSNGGCSTGGCNKLNTYDWFGGMESPGTLPHQAVYEVRFKNTRKAFFRNVNGLPLLTGDMVVVESDRGFDVGQISLSGVLVQLQMKKRRVRPDSDKVRKIYRVASTEDVEKLKTARSREYSTLLRSREIIKELDLDMKLSEVEFQGDNAKAIFYYIADNRVDFRQLIKSLAEEFRIRVEMKQIGLRHEAGLMGGIGSCGRELCCSTWLTDFKTVSTSAARYQNLSLNPMKISGQCGRLKCCLNYELDTYLDALEDIPDIDRIETEIGPGRHQKTDIFKRTMWFSYENETTWIPLSVDIVKEMVKMNKEGKKPASLRAMDEAVPESEVVDFVDVVGQATLRQDRGRGRGRGRGKGRGGRSGGGKGKSQNRGRGGSNRNKGRGGGSGAAKNENPKNQQNTSGGASGEKKEGGQSSKRGRGGNRRKGSGSSQNRGRGRGGRGRGGNSGGNKGGGKPSSDGGENKP